MGYEPAIEILSTFHMRVDRLVFAHPEEYWSPWAAAREGPQDPHAALAPGYHLPVGMCEVVWISIQGRPYARQCARRLDRLSDQRGGFCHLADQNVQIGIGLWWQAAMRHHECNGGIDFIGQDLSG